MPFAKSMMSTLRSNKTIVLDKSKRFRKTLGGYGKQSKIEYNFPKATPQQLAMIRQKLKRENQILWLKVVGLSFFTIGGLFWLLLF